MYYFRDFLEHMRIAIIDLGTNTFHLLIAEVSEKSHLILLKEKSVVKIGHGGISQGVITSGAFERALESIKYFKSKIDQFKVSRAYGTATSAFRNASNGEKLISRIKSIFEIELQIISGDLEARLIFKGVNQAVKPEKTRSLIMDIGGGSVEFIICNQNKLLWENSFEIGAQRLLDRYHKNDPITDLEISKIKNYLEKALSKLIAAVKKYEPQELIGSAGTFDTLIDIYFQHEKFPKEDQQTEFPLPFKEFKRIYQEIIIKNREQRMLIPGMIEMRVDMIVVATVLIQFVLETCFLQKIRVSSYALKEGYLLSIMEDLRNQGLITSK